MACFLFFSFSAICVLPVSQGHYSGKQNPSALVEVLLDLLLLTEMSTLARCDDKDNQQDQRSKKTDGHRAQ